KLDCGKHISFEPVLPDVVSSTVFIATANIGAAFIEGVPTAVLAFVYFFSMEIHPLAAIGTEDFAVKEVDQRGSDFLGLLHLCLPCFGGCIHDVLHLLEVLTGNDCLMGVRKYNPLVLIFDIVGLDSLVDGN